MIAANANYIIENQSSLADDFLLSINTIFKKLTNTKNKINEKQMREYFFRCVQRVHSLNASAETIRDFIECYYINDVAQDETILSQYTDSLMDLIDAVDDSIAEIEALEFEKTMKASLLSSFEQLASTIVNVNFLISQKIAKAYIDSKSDISLLKDA